MSNRLVIVESPAKAKTIKKYLGKDYQVLASYGHVRDLIPKEGAVDPDNDFAMKYQTIDKNAKHAQAIIAAAKEADEILLATDPDREGEAISWHILELLREKKVLKDKPVHRIVFHEITKNAIQAAAQQPREVSMDLVNAQQARRALDYLVGFKLSPLLWRKVRRGLSAGRVQSPALRMIVERELEIEAFKHQEYWTITSEDSFNKAEFTSKLIQYQGKKVEQFTVTQEKQATDIRTDLEKLANGILTVVNVDKKKRHRYPAAPFITSTLQQEAARKLGFTTKKTMQIAQQLYEGIDIGEGTTGLISYMRTDSVNLAQEAIAEIRQLIAELYDAKDLPKDAVVYKTKAKNAQEAHEAIRPTSVHHKPNDIKDYLTPDQYKLYNLIWKRTIACQMIEATLNTVAIDLACGHNNNLFRANGSTVANPGFMKVYLEGEDDTKQQDGDEKLLPELKMGDVVTLNKIICGQHFTEPPPRYSEASLVKALEEHGIGRPSTYASIISTLQQREYVTLDSKRFKPTDVGRVVTRFLTSYFERYVDYAFTAKLEDSLDEVADGKKEWIPLLREFWLPFISLIQDTDKSVQRKDVTQETIDEKCPKCGGALAKRLGRSGTFIGCTAYPECDYTRNVDGEETGAIQIVEGRKCPKCDSDLLVRNGPYGKFIGCSSYPKCKFIESLEQPKALDVKCPTCKTGDMLMRKSRKGKIFYSCSRYPDCSYAIWNEPTNEPCPTCQWPILTIKETKRFGKQKVCPQEGCGFVEAIE